MVYGDGDRSGLPEHIDYEELLAAERPEYPWPDIDEHAAAAMCYTERDHRLAERRHVQPPFDVPAHAGRELRRGARAQPVRPAAAGRAHVPRQRLGDAVRGLAGDADLLLPDRFAQAAPLARFIAAERATLAAAVPTVWYDILGLDPASVDLTSLRTILCGGAAVPHSLIEAYERRAWRAYRPGLGADRDQPGRVPSFPAQARAGGARDGLPGHGRPPARRRGGAGRG